MYSVVKVAVCCKRGSIRQGAKIKKGYGMRRGYTLPHPTRGSG